MRASSSLIRASTASVAALDHPLITRITGKLAHRASSPMGRNNPANAKTATTTTAARSQSHRNELFMSLNRLYEIGSRDGNFCKENAVVDKGGRTANNTVQTIISNADGQTRASRQRLIKSAEQCSPAGENNTALLNVGDEFWRRDFQNRFCLIHDCFDRSAEGFADLSIVDRDLARQAGKKV